ncbi:hypothetical protein QYE76_064576 [Lolium multiflorum]|uniref:Transposase (putative) gypsy type domain-containing protein n=1 Tax=Lolium multiflorum TaxID=4521 RepID=A0AAD8W7S0_LOLMU|nr:hypothetical protein QYE76_064576 [Lolium multiflorum]
MRSLDLISSVKSNFVHPGSASRPGPPKGFTLMFDAFLFRGLSLPAHEFLRSLLFFYGIQLWQLTPNSILHLSIFITLCEAFLGIDPHWGLWRKIFYVKRHNGNDGPLVVGGIVFVVRKEVNYFNYPMKDTVQDSDVPGDEAPEVDAFVKSMRRGKINEGLMATAESSPSGRDDDADTTAYPAPSQEMSTPQVTKGSPRLFAEEDDLESIFSEDEDDVPLSKRAKILSRNAEFAKESMPSTAELTLPPRTSVAKVPLSKVNPSASASAPPISRDHPIFATVDVVEDFGDQCTHLDLENVQLHKAFKTLADQVLEANRLTAEAQNDNTILKYELKKLKKKIKDEQEARRKAFIEADEKEDALRESITSLLSTADMPIDRTKKFRVDSMSDALSFATESIKQLQDLLKKTKEALSKQFSIMFPKLDQNKTLGEMADTFFVDSSEAIEVLKRRSRLYGAVLTFQLLMGHRLGSDLEKLSKALPVDADNCLVNLEPFKQSSVLCANRLLKLVEEDKNKTASEAAPGSSAQA